MNQTITLHQLELYLLDLPQKTVFQSGIGIRKSKETLIVKWIDTEGRVGYGECSCRPDPYYSAEFLEASMILIQKFIAPQLKKSQTYEEVLAILRKIRGWSFTKAAVEAAVFQILRQKNGTKILTEQLKAKPIEKIPVGISLGIYQDEQQMRDVVQEAINDGYQRVKFKIAPSVNVKNFDYINAMLFDNNVHVSFDANGSYRAADLEGLSYFVETYDCHIEQPTPPDRFDILLKAKAQYPKMKICFDEEIKSIGDLIKLHQLNLADEINLKPGRVGGIASSIEILNYCFDNEIPCWIGGMFETGIGRVQNLEIASFLPQARAHDLSPSSRYFLEDIITPEIQMENGFVDLTAAQKGSVDMQRVEKYSTEKWVLEM